MGKDIHPHLEVKVGNNWHHYSCPKINRNHTLFDYLLDNYTPNDVPEDMSVVTKRDFLSPGRNDWQHTHINNKGVAAIHKFCHDRIRSDDDGTPNPKAEFSEYYFDLAWELQASNFSCYEDVRFIYWFDN